MVRLHFNAIIAAVIVLGMLPRAHAADLQRDRTIEKQIPKHVLKDKRNKIFTLVMENDMFGGGTDRNYTSGIRLNYTEVGAKFPAIAHKLDKLIPTFRINRTSSIMYSFGQNLYTPRDITQAVADPNDRPWAAFLYGSIGMVTLTDNHTDEIEATLGVVGPLALGEQAQKLIHKNISNSPIPRGWDNQLKNEPGVMLGWQRGWPMKLKGHIGKKFWSVKPYVGTTLGNVKTYANAGFTLRLSPADSIWQDSPIRVRPAMPGTGIYEIPPHNWSWSFFTGLETRAVARDIFLDGNTFANSPSVDKKTLVTDATAGVSTTYKNTRISYTLVYRTKEFALQDRPEIFGAISAGIRF